MVEFLTTHLSLQALGILYGGLSASTLYTHKITGSAEIKDYEVMGVLSLMIWTLSILHLFKFTVFALSSHGKREGSKPFTLYLLLLQRENHKSSHPLILLLVLLGTSFLICVGILSPTLSVVSGLSGVSTRVPQIDEYRTILGAFTLVFLFTPPFARLIPVKLKKLFRAMILGLWLLFIGGIGLYNVMRWNHRVIYAFSPHYIYGFFKITGIVGLRSLLGIITCIPGAVSMFADLGHFTWVPLRLVSAVFVYACFLLAFMGEAAYLSKHLKNINNGFYHAIPETLFWPVMASIFLATLVSTRATISATFSIICQCKALQFFPRVKMVEKHGNVYIPEIKWLLLCSSIALLIGFDNVNQLKQSYGIAVTGVMFVTTLLIFIVILKVHHKILLAVVFLVIIGVVESIYLGTCLSTIILQGGWFSVLCSFVLVGLMKVWKYGIDCKNAYESQHPVALPTLVTRCIRSPGMLFVYSLSTDEATRFPQFLEHFIRHLPMLPQIVILVRIQRSLFSSVEDSSRFCLNQIGTPEIDTYECVIKLGCFDFIDIPVFEPIILEKLIDFFTVKAMMTVSPPIDEDESERLREALAAVSRNRVMDSKEAGVLYMSEKVSFIASKDSSFFKSICINYVYSMMNRVCRSPASTLGAPSKSLIEVGLVYEV